MSPQAQVKKPAPVAANDGGVPQTAWRTLKPQGSISPVLQLISRQQQQGGGVSEASKRQQQAGKICL
jgi:hypothetical protein